MELTLTQKLKREIFYSKRKFPKFNLNYKLLNISDKDFLKELFKFNNNLYLYVYYDSDIGYYSYKLKDIYKIDLSRNFKVLIITTDNIITSKFYPKIELSKANFIEFFINYKNMQTLKKEELIPGLVVKIGKTIESTEPVAIVKIIEFVEEGLPFYRQPNTSDNSLETFSYQVWKGVVLESNYFQTGLETKFKIPYLYAEAGKRIQPSNPLKGKHKKLEDMTDEEIEALSEEEYVRILNKPIDSFIQINGEQQF